MCSTRATSRLEGSRHAEYSGGGAAAVIRALTSVAPLDIIEEVVSYAGGGESMTSNSILFLLMSVWQTQDGAELYPS